MKTPKLTPVLVARLVAIGAALTLFAILAAADKPWDILGRIGKPSKISHYVEIYEWWAAAINVVLLLVLAAFAPSWLKPVTRLSAAPRPTHERWFWPLVIIAAGFTAFWGAQRLPLSLWDDEESSLRRVILGEYRRTSEGEVRLKEVKWEASLWNYRKPANHQFQTILSRICLDVWRTLSRPQGLQFTETVVRFPCYLAGILSVLAIAWMLKALGLPGPGVIAAFLLAIHPWHIRYAVELRGYVFTLLFGPLMLGCLLKALQTGRWVWWAGFAGAEFALLYSYPGCLYMLVAANLCGLVASVPGKSAPVPGNLMRLIVASTLAAMLYLQLMLPCIPQLLEYFHTERALGDLTPRWHRNLFAHFAAGIPWNNSDLRDAGYNELQWMAEAYPIVFNMMAGLALLFLTVGLARLMLVRPHGWMIPAVLIFPGLCVYFASRHKGHYLYEWYLLFVLPGVVAAVAAGMAWLAGSLGRVHKLLPPVLTGAAILVFAVVTSPQRRWLLTHPLQPMRDSVLQTRPTLDPFDPRQKNIITLSLTGAPLPYDANLIEISTVEELTRHLREADQNQKVLFVNFANAWAAASGMPRLFAMIEDDRLFEKTASLQGFDPTLTAHIRRYKPGSIASYEVQQ